MIYLLRQPARHACACGCSPLWIAISIDICWLFLPRFVDKLCSYVRRWLYMICFAIVFVFILCVCVCGLVCIVCACRSSCPSTLTCRRSSLAPPPSTPPSAAWAPSCSWCTLSSITTGPSTHWSAVESTPKASVRPHTCQSLRLHGCLFFFVVVAVVVLHT